MSKYLFIGVSEDIQYLPFLKHMIVGDNSCSVYTKPIATKAEVALLCKEHNFLGVFTTSTTLLAKLLDLDASVTKSPSLDNYLGSLFQLNVPALKVSVPVVIVSPLKHCVTVPYGKFILERCISKLTSPNKWPVVPKFSYEVANESNISELFSSYLSASLIAVDIETSREPLGIRCVGYTAVWFNSDGTYRTHSCVVPTTSLFFLTWIRKFNWELKAAKILQNGKYDNAYFLRYNAPLYNWLWDTATMFHCWYSELPKNLAFLGAFFIREAMYWKDLAHTSDLEQYYEYNCRDHWTTAIIAIEWMKQSPQWAKDNYLLEFPLNFPAILCEMTGIKRDFAALELARTKIAAQEAAHLAKFQAMVGVKINPASPPKMKLLLKALGMGDVASSDEATLNKAMFLHPFNTKLLSPAVEIRGLRKLISTYLGGKTIEDRKEYKGTLLYTLNPHGTDTGRLSSGEHHFWCGANIQNIPRGGIVKNTLVAYDGFRFAEVDSEQAESRDTAYAAGDPALIAAVSGDRDFHSVNCSAFFGVPYDAIYSTALKKALNKALRDLAKRVNHGANYNMGPAVLVATMGLNAIYEAARLLNLPKFWGPLQIAKHLLAQFHKTYPLIAGSYYPYVVRRVVTTKLLKGGGGWTRYCFGHPDKNKSDLNALVAHCPQSENAMRLNKAFLKIFLTIQLNPLYSANFKLIAQIHDSVLFQFREGHEYLCELVKKCMELEVTVTGPDKVARSYTVPASIKAGHDGKGTKYWGELE